MFNTIILDATSTISNISMSIILEENRIMREEISGYLNESIQDFKEKTKKFIKFLISKIEDVIIFVKKYFQNLTIAIKMSWQKYLIAIRSKQKNSNKRKYKYYTYEEFIEKNELNNLNIEKDFDKAFSEEDLDKAQKWYDLTKLKTSSNFEGMINKIMYSHGQERTEDQAKAIGSLAQQSEKIYRNMVIASRKSNEFLSSLKETKNELKILETELENSRYDKDDFDKIKVSINQSNLRLKVLNSKLDAHKQVIFTYNKLWSKIHKEIDKINDDIDEKK